MAEDTVRAWLSSISARLDRRNIVGKDGSLYLERYRVSGWMPGDATNPRCNAYLHRFLRPDEDPELHNHPWPWACSLILAGGYVEQTMRGQRILRPGAVNLFHGDKLHRVSELLEADCWTLFVTGPKSQSWGFLVPWRTFLRTKGQEPAY